jgi:hypothetical protein
VVSGVGRNRFGENRPEHLPGGRRPEFPPRRPEVGSLEAQRRGFRLREDSTTKEVKRSAGRLEECGSGTQPTDGKCSGFRLIGEA